VRVDTYGQKRDRSVPVGRRLNEDKTLWELEIRPQEKKVLPFGSLPGHFPWEFRGKRPGIGVPNGRQNGNNMTQNCCSCAVDSRASRNRMSVLFVSGFVGRVESSRPDPRQLGIIAAFRAHSRSPGRPKRKGEKSPKPREPADMASRLSPVLRVGFARPERRDRRREPIAR
jgi:hypothetical protein